MKPLIVAYARQWHLSRSDAFRDLLLEPMQPYAEVEMRSWNRGSLLPPMEAGVRYVFCGPLPPRDWLQMAPAQLVWIPMWDNVRDHSQAWWNGLPESLRIVAFSRKVLQRARQAGLRVLPLRYFKDPNTTAPVDWSHGRVLCYWNRAGLISPGFLQHLCTALKVKTLLYRSDLDPRLPEQVKYDLPNSLGATTVETLPVFHSRQEYLDATRAANLFIAPRIVEGVGMVFLEAMARGCAVFGYNDATMNEYIASGQNGYLFKGGWIDPRTVGMIRTKLARRGIGGWPQFGFSLRENDQNWREIAALDVERIGHAACEQHQAGYHEWLSQLATYSQFLLSS